VIGDADTLAPRPNVPTKSSRYAKGVNPGLNVSLDVKGLSYVYDDFDDVDDWINVHGALGVSGGASSDVRGPSLGYAAGYHKTQMLTDNHRVKVTIQDGIMLYGESRVVICSDDRMTRYYGMAIDRGLLISQVSIIRGTSSISVDKYETTTISLSAADEFEVWYDRINSTVRVYQNDSEIASKFFEPNDIPHGPGNRYVGVVMGTNWLIDIGPNFDDFEAFDVAEPAPVVNDPIDALTPNPSWVEVLNGVQVNRHLLQPQTLGPDNVLYSSSAVRWDTPMGTDSVKVVVTVFRFFAGTYTIVVRSNADMTNWIGIEFEYPAHTVKVVTGTGPTTVTARAVETRVLATTGQQFTVVWDEDEDWIYCYRGASRTPLVEWDASGNFTGSGRYVGQVWSTSLLTSGVEPSAFTAYDVDNDRLYGS